MFETGNIQTTLRQTIDRIKYPKYRQKREIRLKIVYNYINKTNA